MLLDADGSIVCLYVDCAEIRGIRKVTVRPEGIGASTPQDDSVAPFALSSEKKMSTGVTPLFLMVNLRKFVFMKPTKLGN